MASAIIASDRIDKLNGNNYKSWKYNVKMTLVQRGLRSHVTGEEVRPQPPAEVKEFNRKEENALATIALSIEVDQQTHILDCTTAKETWDTLEKVFEPKSRSRILQLKTQMISVKFESNETMTSYLNRLKTCSDRLKETECEVKDEELAYAMLSELPNSYESLTMSLANLEDERFTSSEIRNTLLNEYERRQTKEVAAINESPVTATQKEAYHQGRAPNYRRTEAKKEDRGCYRCGKPGHIANYCRAKETDRVRISRNSRAQIIKVKVHGYLN